ncbi:10245_t:CDS:2 [Rhizophagus irregularis]|nr:10245_t:CDS:2 [Rhizophagus irregularis]
MKRCTSWIRALRINNLMPAKKLQTIQQLQTQLTQLQLRNNSLLIKSEERECENILEL